MRLGKVIKVAYWIAAALMLFLVVVLEKNPRWLIIIASMAFAFAMALESTLLFRKASFQSRFKNLDEYAAHQRYSVADLKSAMASGGMLDGLSIQASLSGIAEGNAKKKAPLSDKDCLAYRIEAEVMEGLWKEAGQTHIVESYWGTLNLQDATGSVQLRGPGILDTSGVLEKIVSLSGIKASYPALSDSLKTILGIFEEKEAKKTRIKLREIILVPEEKIVVYGIAESGKNGLALSGSDEVNDKDSLFIRSERKPASSRFGKKIPQAVFMAALALASLSLGLGFAVKILSKPGAILDFSQTGKIVVQPEGKTFRLRRGEQYWDFKPGETRDLVELYHNEELFTVDKSTVLKLEKIVSVRKTLRNGDPEYPRWDGQQWLLTLDKTPAIPEKPATTGGEGRLYIRNITDKTFTMRVLQPDRGVSITTIWTFNPLEGADNPLGQWLNRKETGAVLVKADNFVELITKTGAKRILRVGNAASWQDKKSWLLDVVPELLAGSGVVYAKNQGDILANIRILGADGKPMYGDSPWVFEPKEGVDKNLGLALQSQDKDITISGREDFIVDYVEFVTVTEAVLKELAVFKDGAWTLAAGKYFTE